MKKIIISSIIACTLASSSNSWCMLLKALRTTSFPYSRTLFGIYTFPQPEKNIFNASGSAISLRMLEDLYGRNNSFMHRLHHMQEKLQEQNAIAVNHTYHNEPLDMTKLKTLEQGLKKDLASLSAAIGNAYQSHYGTQAKDHTNE
jgi:hypothetical protein